MDMNTLLYNNDNNEVGESLTEAECTSMAESYTHLVKEFSIELSTLRSSVMSEGMLSQSVIAFLRTMYIKFLDILSRFISMVLKGLHNQLMFVSRHAMFKVLRERYKQIDNLFDKKKKIKPIGSLHQGYTYRDFNLSLIKSFFDEVDVVSRYVDDKTLPTMDDYTLFIGEMKKEILYGSVRAKDDMGILSGIVGVVENNFGPVGISGLTDEDLKAIVVQSGSKLYPVKLMDTAETVIGYDSRANVREDSESIQRGFSEMREELLASDESKLIANTSPENYMKRIKKVKNTTEYVIRQVTAGKGSGKHIKKTINDLESWRKAHSRYKREFEKALKKAERDESVSVLNETMMTAMINVIDESSSVIGHVGNILNVHLTMYVHSTISVMSRLADELEVMTNNIEENVSLRRKRSNKTTTTGDGYPGRL